MSNETVLVDGLDFTTEGNHLIALSKSANDAVQSALEVHAYPFTQYLSALTPESTYIRTVVNFAPYDGLIEKAKETIQKFTK